MGSNTKKYRETEHTIHKFYLKVLVEKDYSFCRQTLKYLRIYDYSYEICFRP